MILLETILEEQFQNVYEDIIPEESSLDFLEEYLAGRRGISLQEAKYLIDLIESDTKAKDEIVDAIEKGARKKADGWVSEKRKKFGNWIGGVKEEAKKAKTPEAKKKFIDIISPEGGKLRELDKWSRDNAQTISGWAKNKKQQFHGMSSKKKMAVVAAAVGVPVVAGGLHAYARHRRHQREKKEDKD
jgi:hypothetical protein